MKIPITKPFFGDEEKRAVIENQLKEQLYNWREDVRPRVIGKFDEHGEWILPSADELTPARIARVIAKRIARFHTSPQIEERLKFLEQKEKALTGYQPPIRRIALSLPTEPGSATLPRAT